MPPAKEIEFFNVYWDNGLDWYVSRFDDAAGASRVGEASPMYLSNRLAMRRLHETLPEAALISILREPAAAAHSLFHYRAARGHDSGAFEDALRREEQGIAGAFPYIASRAYGDHLDFVVDELGRDVTVLWYDDLVGDPAGLFAELAASLDIAPFELADPTVVVNSADRFRSVRLRNRTRHAPQLVQRVVGRFNRVSVTYPPLTDATRARIHAQLADSTRSLEMRTGRNLSAWR